MAKVESIERNDSDLDAGYEEYFLITADMASLEARGAAIDTICNEQGLDPVLAEVYATNSKYGEDLHTASSFAVFGAPGANVQAMDLEYKDKDGKDVKITLIEESLVKIKRGEKTKVIKAGILEESDDILEVSLDPESKYKVEGMPEEVEAQNMLPEYNVIE